MCGPLFVSIGDAEKLRVFLDANPALPRDDVFVDGYAFAAYEAAGFGSFALGGPPAGDAVTAAAAERAKAAAQRLKPPNLALGQWLRYFGAVGAVSPIPPGMRFGEVPQGVLRLGGTFVIAGDVARFAHSDALPGDHPRIDDVIAAALA